MQDLGTLGGSSSDAAAINDSGQVVGWADTSAGSSHAFLYSAGTMQDLGTLGGSDSQAYAINASGQVVGWSSIVAGYQRAFLYTNGTMQDLNSLIPAGSGWVLMYPTSINKKGQIVGWGDLNNQSHAFLLTPTTAASAAQATTASSLPSGPQATISTATAAPTVTAATFSGPPFVVGPTVTPTTTIQEGEENVVVDPTNSKTLFAGVVDFSIYVDIKGTNTLLGYGTQTSPGEWTFTFAVNLTPGTHTLFSQAEDGYGAFGDPTVPTLTVQ
jgi:probable HAF family extracellular repeat protein